MNIKKLALAFRIKRGDKVITGYRGKLIVGKVVIVEYHSDRYIISFNKPTGMIALCRKRHQIDVINEDVNIDTTNEELAADQEWAEEEECIHLELM